MHDFKSLRVWNAAMDHVVEIYQLTQQFPNDERFGLTQQIRRAAVSIPSNIAEGAFRNSDKEFNQFLGISNGSCGEVITQLFLAERLGYCFNVDISQLIEKTEIIQKMNSKLQLSLKIK